MSFSLISLVIPFLSDGSVDLILLQGVKHSSADGLGPFDEFGEGVNLSVVIDLLVFLSFMKWVPWGYHSRFQILL